MGLFTGDGKADIKYHSLGPVLQLNTGDAISNNNEGPSGKYLGIIIDGYAKMIVSNQDGRESIITFLKPVSSFGDIRVFTGRNSHHNLLVVAVTPVKYIMVTKEDLLSLIKNDPELALFLLKSSSEKIESLISRLYGESFQNSLVVIADVLLALGSIEKEIHISHLELSETIGRNRVTVSRALLKLQKAGAIEQGNRRIIIKNHELLKQISNGT